MYRVELENASLFFNSRVSVFVKNAGTSKIVPGRLHGRSRKPNGDLVKFCADNDTEIPPGGRAKVNFMPPPYSCVSIRELTYLQHNSETIDVSGHLAKDSFGFWVVYPEPHQS